MSLLTRGRLCDGVIANRLKNDYILCPDMRQRSIAGCYQNNVAWLYLLWHIIVTPLKPLLY
ncbi:hypothetical protein [Symbiopectobacterium purcellii]|uniref:hypothetical protein n=1 Tax=Symbiopectobacterium purcellii TaxID=2871826 RepID=UPI003F84D1FE